MLRRGRKFPIIYISQSTPISTLMIPEFTINPLRPARTIAILFASLKLVAAISNFRKPIMIAWTISVKKVKKGSSILSVKILQHCLISRKISHLPR